MTYPAARQDVSRPAAVKCTSNKTVKKIYNKSVRRKSDEASTWWNWALNFSLLPGSQSKSFRKQHVRSFFRKISSYPVYCLIPVLFGVLGEIFQLCPWVLSWNGWIPIAWAAKVEFLPLAFAAVTDSILAPSSSFILVQFHHTCALRLSSSSMHFCAFLSSSH